MTAAMHFVSSRTEMFQILRSYAFCIMVSWYVGMDQYLLIPFLGGWTSIYQLFWCSPGVQGFDTLPCVFLWWQGSCPFLPRIIPKIHGGWPLIRTESVDPSRQVLFCGYLAWKYIPMCAAHWIECLRISYGWKWLFFCLKPGNFQTYQLIFFPTNGLTHHETVRLKVKTLERIGAEFIWYIIIYIYIYIYIHLMILNRMVMGLNCQENWEAFNDRVFSIKSIHILWGPQYWP